MQRAIVKPFEKLDTANDDLQDKADAFIKNLSLAFAEMSSGDVYLLVSEGPIPGN